MRARIQRGFTLIELMMVVVVLGIIVAVAVVAYRRNVLKARAGEIPMMFGEFKTKEDQWAAENGRYVALCPEPDGDGACAEDAFFPEDLPGGGDAVDITGGVPDTWSQLRVNPGKGLLYCQYVVVAGLAGESPAGDLGTELFPAPPARNWYYMVAQCNWDSDADTNELHWQRGDLSTIGRENEGR